MPLELVFSNAGLVVAVLVLIIVLLLDYRRRKVFRTHGYTELEKKLASLLHSPESAHRILDDFTRYPREVKARVINTKRGATAVIYDFESAKGLIIVLPRGWP